MKFNWFVVGAIAITLFSLCSAYALDKADPDSRSGHGQARDVWLIKNTDEIAKCGGPVSTQTNPNTGTVMTSCRVNGVVREVEKQKQKGGSK
jgi:hypothetical protein